MVRFSCFHAHGHSTKPKKTVQLSVEAMQKTMEDSSKNPSVKDFKDSCGIKDSLPLKVQGDAVPNNVANHVTSSSSIERNWKSDEINSNYNVESDRGLQHSGRIKKSLSLGSGLDREGMVSVVNNSEDEAEIGYSCDGSLGRDGMVVPVGGKDTEINLTNRYQEAPPSDSLQGNHDSIFSIEDSQQLEKEVRENEIQCSSGECKVESSDTPRDPFAIGKSKSLPNIDFSDENPSLTYLAPQPRSSEDFTVLDLRRKEMVTHEIATGVMNEQERDEGRLNKGKSICEDGYDSYNYVGSAKDWIVPINVEEHLHGESSTPQWKEILSKDLKIKRIEEWVVDLQHCSPLEGTNDAIPNVDDHHVQKGYTVVDNLLAARCDGRVTPGMEAAKKCISSFSAATTSAQLANHGLVVIPFLSAFVSLRALNLSGNAIVRITAGALPRGLHSLNLSKNSISTIEGLRELTRLRVLDLSYNRIVRIGHVCSYEKPTLGPKPTQKLFLDVLLAPNIFSSIHLQGLASCSSLKELYLAGNKISEVEGLHRLLKLNVLDLRFNKISTAKCLGQLAANYNSLQAVSLEGNPAQKNVGDEQLKKYLMGVLPHLTYFNRQSVKAGTLKDVADRSTRLGITADRGLRSDHKNLRKATHGAASALKTPLTSSANGRRGQAVVSLKPSKGKPGRLPPVGTKTATSHRQNLYDFSSKLLSFRPDLSMRRSRSEGTLAAL
ncbi:hypothetical protein RHSIM_Rhsim04G0058800 [Rhododendron simsii]|uniref:Outer arm dynein light chain 1 protein n=1 Tax=Rhododendron simsii TaxID=118357 RepID=A0A834GYG6_RHOSS|nr:hypothetical protein RHSIM_Rhsim04G0058800 [Rhododendron simsii]